MTEPPTPIASPTPETSAVRRLVGAGTLVVLIAAGLAVHSLLPDTDATDITGDALYAAAVYAGLVAVAPRWHPLVVGGIALGWCVGIELFQLTGMPLALGAVLPPAMLVLGTVFDVRDLVVYAVTVTVVTALDGVVGAALAKRRRSPHEEPSHRGG